MNVIVIIIDTLRYDYIGANGRLDIKTPNLDRLSHEGWTFDASFAASYPTIPHRTDAITGRYGAPFHPWQPLGCNVSTLPGVLAEHGYCTQLIHDTPHLVNGGHNFDYPFHAWSFIRGAEVDRPWLTDGREQPENWAPDPLFDGVEAPPVHATNMGSYARANYRRRTPEDWNCAKLFRAAADFVRENARRERFFLWLDCFDPHEPWDAPPEFVRLYDQTPGYDGRIDPRSFAARDASVLSPEARQRIVTTYAAKVSWVDHCLGKLLEALEETGLDRRTGILLTADHGTNLGERGRYGKGYPVRQQEAHTPFIVRAPDAGSGCCDSLVQPQDIFATALAMAGVPCPPGLESRNLLGVAQAGADESRPVVLAGRGVSAGWAKPGAICFSVIDNECLLELAAAPEDCRLIRHGTLKDIAAENPGRVVRMRDAGLQELARRGADPRLVTWLQREGRAAFPAEARFTDAPTPPPGWSVYFRRLYRETLS